MSNVKLKYDPTGPRDFTFIPYALVMSGQGTIMVTREAGGPTGWKFVTATFKDDPSRQFRVKVVGDGQSLQIKDEFHNRDPAIYMYNVTIALENGEHVTSPDPVIVNDPGARLDEES